MVVSHVNETDGTSRASVPTTTSVDSKVFNDVDVRSPNLNEVLTEGSKVTGDAVNVPKSIEIKAPFVAVIVIGLLISVTETEELVTKVSGI